MVLNSRMVSYLFVAYVIALSLIPLIPLRGWQGYGPSGEFYYTGDKIHIRYNDPSFGNDKPHIFVAESGRTISLIEVSGYNSYVNGKNLYYDFDKKTRVVDNKLVVFHTSPNLFIVQEIIPMDDSVRIVYRCNCTMNMTLTLWRWTYESVAGFDRPVTRELDPSNVIPFSVADGGRIYKAQLLLSPTPRHIEISGIVPDGLNKITLELVGDEIVIDVVLVGATDVGWIPALDVRDSKYLYPMIATVSSVFYLALLRKSSR